MHIVRWNITLLRSIIWEGLKKKKTPQNYKETEKYVICPKLNRMAGYIAEMQFWLNLFASRY